MPVLSSVSTDFGSEPKLKGERELSCSLRWIYLKEFLRILEGISLGRVRNLLQNQDSLIPNVPCLRLLQWSAEEATSSLVRYESHFASLGEFEKYAVVLNLFFLLFTDLVVIVSYHDSAFPTFLQQPIHGDKRRVHVFEEFI